MQFNSLTYLAFLAMVVVVYWALPQRGRLWLILVSSLTFYGFWRFEFIPLMLFSAGLDYSLARLIEKSSDERRRRQLLFLSIAASLLILCIFKYLIFFENSIGSLGALLGRQLSWPELHIILPLGISFYIFATISYTVDVYRRLIPAERSPLVYFCFVTFFPHLVAGPILRAGVLIPQLKRPLPFDWSYMALGVRRILLGLFLKVALADNIAPFVNKAFEGQLSLRHGADAWAMAFLFGFQIYFDFAAYSSIAIGSALLMGIVLPENFDFPYFVTSPRELWKHWHISLSSWARDYLYMPLTGATPKGQGWAVLPAAAEGGGKAERKRTAALFITWTLMGLWHGANWTFAIWGLFHAVCLSLQRMLNRAAPWVRRMPPIFGWLVTLPLMMAAWIPFRAANLRDAFLLWGRMLDPRGFLALSLQVNTYLNAVLLLVAMAACYLFSRFGYPPLARRPMVLAVGETLAFTVVFMFTFVFFQVRDQFIYFQF